MKMLTLFSSLLNKLIKISKNTINKETAMWNCLQNGTSHYDVIDDTTAFWSTGQSGACCFGWPHW